MKIFSLQKIMFLLPAGLLFFYLPAKAQSATTNVYGLRFTSIHDVIRPTENGNFGVPASLHENLYGDRI